MSARAPQSLRPAPPARRLFRPAGVGRAALFCVFLASTSIVGGARAAAQGKAPEKTIAQKRIEATKRLAPLKKITVGPDDQYNAAIDPSGQWLVYSHKADLVPHLRLQSLATGDFIDLLPLTSDSQEPAFAPSGRLAFTYYKKNARGDVCFTNEPIKAARPLGEGDFRCFERGPDEADSERANPFWISEDEIGFVSRPIASQVRSIRAQSSRAATTALPRTLVDGQVWAPAMRPGGRWLAYNEVVEAGAPMIGRRALTLQDLKTGKKTPVFFDLPGFSGFPAISDDEAYIYFSHYLNDTNGDNAIDGGDNAVIFRIKLDAATGAAGKPVLPEQLTSVESSCSYPRPAGAVVYATCAFEGSLDIYALPATGAVPSDWDPMTLLEARRTSRSYDDRILLLNALQYRAPQMAAGADEALLVTHVLADDVSSANFYLGRLEAAARPADKAYLALLRLYLRARALRRAQPSDEPSREFRAAIAGIGAEAAKTPGSGGFQATVQGALRALVGEKREALAFYLRAKAQQQPGRSVRPLERALSLELALSVLDQAASGAAARELDSAFATMVTAPELDEEAQVYYAFQFLRQAEASEKSPAARIARIDAFLEGKTGAVATLLASEKTCLSLVLAASDAEKLKAYRDLDALMIQTQRDYFLRKALYVRAILNFTAAAEFKYMSLVTAAWLKYTAPGETEYAYAREVFARASLEEGYGYLASDKPIVANGFFYESLSLTDDLESHFNYVLSTIKIGERNTLAFRYGNLQKRQFVGDNMKFVEALLALLDADKPAIEGRAGASGGATSAIDDALKKLLAMEQDRDSAVRRLLLGYCYLAKMMRSASGPDFDARLFESAHRELMLAYDLGRANARVASAALINLGLLHERAQNHALAARFFAQRKAYPFSSPEDGARFAALYARALFGARQPAAAAEALAAIPAAAMTDPLRERRAFYLMSAGRYAEAASAYAEAWPRLQASGDANLARIGLAYGFAAFKSAGNSPGIAPGASARDLLMAAAARAAKLPVVKKGGDQLVDFEPKRIELAAQGLLGRIGSPTERAQALEARARLLQGAKADVDNWLETTIQNRLSLAELYAQASDWPRASEQMAAALKEANELGQSSGFLGQATYQTAMNEMALGLLHPGSFGSASAGLGDASEEALKKLVDGCLNAYEALKTSAQASAPTLDLQRTKLLVLWAAHSAQRSGSSGAKKKEAIAAALVAPAAGRVRAALPAAWQDVVALARSAQ